MLGGMGGRTTEGSGGAIFVGIFGAPVDPASVVQILRNTSGVRKAFLSCCP